MKYIGIDLTKLTDAERLGLYSAAGVMIGSAMGVVTIFITAGGLWGLLGAASLVTLTVGGCAIVRSIKYEENDETVEVIEL